MSVSAGDSSFASSACIFAPTSPSVPMTVKLPPSQLGRLAHQVRVGRRTDSDGKEPRASELRAYLLEQRILVGNAGVGHEHDLAEVARRGVALKRGLERTRQHRCPLSQCHDGFPTQQVASHIDNAGTSAPFDRFSPPIARASPHVVNSSVRTEAPARTAQGLWRRAPIDWPGTCGRGESGSCIDRLIV